jgi:hypothetical protein
LWTTQGAEEQSSLKSDYLDDSKIVNVIIAKNFNQTQDDIQIQALEVAHHPSIALSFISLSPVIEFKASIFQNCGSYHAK